MNDFTFLSPTRLIVGRKAEEQTGEWIKQYGGHKVLVHHDSMYCKTSGLVDKIIANIQAAGVETVELGGVVPNPHLSLVYEGIELCRKENVDFVLAVGGGSTIDSAKAIAAGVVYEGDFWDFYQGKYIEKALPLGTVLTISAAGSEGSPDSVITYEDGMFKRGATGDAIRPAFTVLNPALTKTLPPYQTACGITDIIAHLYERYLTNTTDVEVTDRLIEALMLTMVKEGPVAVANQDDYASRANIMWAAMLAHNNCCGVGRTQCWNSHNIEHELSAIYDCAHGAGLAVTMPAVFTYVMNHNVMRFAQVATRVWGCEMDFEHPEKTAKAGIEALRRFLISIGMPKNFEELGAKEEDIETLAHNCCYGDVREGTISGFVTLNQADVEAIYRLML